MPTLPELKIGLKLRVHNNAYIITMFVAKFTKISVSSFACEHKTVTRKFETEFQQMQSHKYKERCNRRRLDVSKLPSHAFMSTSS